MKTPYSPNKTSARLLVDFAGNNWGDCKTQPERMRYLMVYDLYIKARSYAILNKIFFGFAVIAGMLLLIWPAVAYRLDDLGVGFSAVVQTCVTGLAALMFALYSHYKKRQTYMENLMRHVIFSGESIEVMFEKVLREMERIDQGFAFTELVLNKTKAPADEADR
jgi:hypothetical protein